ncbi:DUF6408 family protein [Streptomyces rubrogriseus]|uniref:DUF6408 family protein n=1 Tax=Streptomyces rubrogriseus TaxID=194673 RepID=UPI002F41A2FD
MTQPLGALPAGAIRRRHRSNRRGRIPVVAVEYTPKRRTWVRDVLVGIVASIGSNLAWTLAQFVVHRLG